MLWADTIQFFIMVGGQLVLVIRGCLIIGGPGRLFQLAQQGGRLNMLDTVAQFNPILRISTWTYFLGGVFRCIVPYVSYQMLIQRFCTVKSPKQASVMTWLNLPMFAGVAGLIGLNGLVRMK